MLCYYSLSIGTETYTNTLFYIVRDLWLNHQDKVQRFELTDRYITLLEMESPERLRIVSSDLMTFRTIAGDIPIVAIFPDPIKPDFGIYLGRHIQTSKVIAEKGYVTIDTPV